MGKRFIGEALRPVAGTFDTGRMASGGPGLPGEFIWRGERVRVAKVVGEWRETAPCRHGSGERYASKHWFDLEAEDGRVMRVYFERRVRGRARAARWWLFSVEGARPAACCASADSICDARNCTLPEVCN